MKIYDRVSDYGNKNCDYSKLPSNQAAAPLS